MRRDEANNSGGEEKGEVPLVIAAIDPGREKCGLAVVDESGVVLDQEVVATVWLTDELADRIERFLVERVLVGNGTTGGDAKARIEETFPALAVEAVNEYRTTDDAKRAYWAAHPPTGWRRFFPTSMQVPPVPVDDFVAVLLAQRYLINRREG